MEGKTVQIILEGHFKNGKVIVKNLKHLQNQLDKLPSHTKSINSLVDSLKKIGKIIGIGYLTKKIKDLGVNILNTAGRFEQYDIAFTTMLQSQEKGRKLLEDVIDFAKKTPFEIEGLVKSTKQLKAMGIGLDELFPTLKMLGSIAAGVNVPLERLAMVYGKVQTSGQLMGRHLNQFTQAGIPLLQALTKTLGLTRAEVIKLKEKGEISFNDVRTALQSLTSEGGMFFDLMQRQSIGWLGIINNIQDGWTIVKLTIGNAVLPVAKKFALSFLKWLDEIVIKIKENTENIQKFANTIIVSLQISYKLGFKPLIWALLQVAKGIAAIMKYSFAKWILGVAVAVKVLRVAFTLLAKNPILFMISSLIGLVGFLIEKFEALEYVLLIIERDFLFLKRVAIEAIHAILKSITALDKIPGFKWVSEAKKQFSDFAKTAAEDWDKLAYKIGDVEQRLFRAKERIGFDVDTKVEGAKVETPMMADLDQNVESFKNAENEKLAISQDITKQLEDLEKEFYDGKISLQELEDEQELIRIEQKVAQLNQWYNKQIQDTEKTENAKQKIREKYFNAYQKLENNRLKLDDKNQKDTVEGISQTLDSVAKLQSSKYRDMAEIGKAAAVAQITVDSATAAMAAYKSLVGIPFIGPALAVAAAASTLVYGAERISQVKSAPSFEVGADEIPIDMAAQVHKGEMIIPATFAESIRRGDLVLSGGTENAENIQTQQVQVNVDLSEDAKNLGFAVTALQFENQQLGIDR
jgi:tape measure domain-containing protein